MPEDTIDLQDQTSPSAQDHSRKPHSAPLGAGPAAPHQASELRHVKEERHIEEEHLSQAWNQSNGLSDEPPSDDDERYTDGMQDDQAMQRNGGQSGSGEESDMTDQDGDERGENELMDKISSSPSISDGGYFF